MRHWFETAEISSLGACKAPLRLIAVQLIAVQLIAVQLIAVQLIAVQ